MKKKNNALRFSKQDIADLTKDEQGKLIGGEGTTIYNYDYTIDCYENTYKGCAFTDTCTQGC